MILRCMASVVLLLLLAVGCVQAQVCCHTCLQSLGPSSYDATVFAQCDKKTPGCCFCDAQKTIGAPAFEASVAQGTWQKVAWSEVVKVTSINVAASAASSPRPQLTFMLPPVAQDKAGNYLFCSDTPGEILFRGWGPLANTPPSNCTSISGQLSITVTAGGKAKCADSSPTTKPGGGGSGTSSGSSGAVTKAPNNSSVACDSNRGYLDGNTCKCLSDYSGPPECNGMALWKLLVSIGGGLAALFSIAVSIRQFMLFQRRKKEEEELANAPVDHSSKNFDTMYAMPASHEYYDSIHANANRSTEASGHHAASARPSMPESSAVRPSFDHLDPRMQPRESKEYTL